MSLIPNELRYTKEHEWVAATDSAGIFRMGITDFAQSALGDIVYIQMPKSGEEVIADKICGEVESTKSVSEIYAPVTGKIAIVNDLLNGNPELINSDCYGQGWIAEIEVADISVIEKLLSAQQYQELTA
ncbi:MAG: glycine cleavage system protein GcvH [Actinobacteria bacterium]|jgi:glycine cleavage system H protein|nr:glycine cleavage system protein GcvH [Actinomycetota bacterium]NDH12453.1 glycine cleavage system protein GcvH [Actinomycetota bacterium]